MKKVALLLLLHAGHYITTHKVLLASDAIAILAANADAASTIYGLHANPNLIETNPLLPAKPTGAQVFGLANGSAAAIAAADHAIWHFTHDDGIVFAPGVAALASAIVVKRNIDQAR